MRIATRAITPAPSSNSLGIVDTCAIGYAEKAICTYCPNTDSRLSGREIHGIRSRFMASGGSAMD